MRPTRAWRSSFLAACDAIALTPPRWREFEACNLVCVENSKALSKADACTRIVSSTKYIACNGLTRAFARTRDLCDGVPSRRRHDTVRVAATPRARNMAVLPQTINVARIAHGVAPPGVGPTNPADRTTFVRFLVKVQCFERRGFSRFLNAPVEVDLDGEVRLLARAVYYAAMEEWPDLRPTHISARRGRKPMSISDLDQSVREVMPMAWNDELLWFRLHEDFPIGGPQSWG